MKNLQWFKSRYENIISSYRKNAHAYVFLREHTELVHSFIANIWNTQYQASCPELTVLATGGFGRAELYPHSDIDLLIIGPETLSETEEQCCAEFIQTLWDYHFSPAPKIGSLQQILCSAREDITADTAFLENNFIAGNQTLSQLFVSRLFNQRDVLAFCEGKILEQQQRYQKERNKDSMLEPNIKTCPGGLRDLHTLVWLAKAQGLSANIHDLVIHNLVTKDEARLLFHSHKQLARMRIDLHLETRRKEDCFIFDLQTRIAQIWGFQDKSKKIRSEQIMQVLYRALKTVKQINYILVPVLRTQVSSPFPRVIARIDDDFYQINDQLAVHDIKVFNKHPSFILKALTILQENRDITGFDPKCLRALWHARRKINSKFVAKSENRQLFIQLFIRGNRLTHALRFMNLYDMLGRYLPAWRKIVGLMQYDLFHIFPVDDHSLMVVRNLRRLSMEIHSHELPFYSELMQQFEPKHILYLAAVFHDIAKGRNGDHALLGEDDARKFASNHFLSDEETQLLCWLVREHLLMSQTAQKEDIHDIEVIKRFCVNVQNQQRLVALFLLTCADIRATNPNIWNSWKASLLSNLFYLASTYMKQGEHNLGTHKEKVTEILLSQGYGLKDQKHFWHSLGEAYFARYQNSDILWHASELIGKETIPQVRARMLEGSQTVQFMVYLPDGPGIFARICRFFAQEQMNIVDARIYTTEDGFVLDTFVVQNTDLDSEALRNLSNKLPQKLLSFLSATEQNENSFIKQHLASRRLRNFPITPQVTLYPQDSPFFYLLEIISGDYPGLLARIAEILTENNIRLYYAKISTLGERVEDSFLISSAQLDQTAFQLHVKEQLYQILHG